MNIAELLYNIVMEDGSPEAWEIIEAIPEEHRENIAKLWEAGYEKNIPNANSLTRLQSLVNNLKAGKYAFDSETGEPMHIIPKSSSPEQVQDLEKELGTGGNHANKTDTENAGMSEQERELRDAILGGMREGPDNRF